MIDTECLSVAVLFLVGGMAVPFRYGMKRLRGFGRYVADRLPQQE